MSAHTKETGFTLVEVMVAMLILTIGVLGLAASSSTIVRMSSSGSRSAESASLANARLDILRMTPCATLGAGTEANGGYTLTWRVTTNATFSLLRDVLLVVSYNEPGASRNATYETQVSCAPSVTGT